MVTQATGKYTGRFAPSPTGPLHLGSLIGALASFLDARAAGGRWLVRIEDIDPLREVDGASSSILRSLESHGLEWDASPEYQSRNYSRYQAILNQLCDCPEVYLCPCSRKYLGQHDGQHRPECQSQQLSDDRSVAIKFHPSLQTINLIDLIQGPLDWQLQPGKDDFVLQRKEGFYAYQLAVVVDDHYQNISHVVRGTDLLDSTPLQLCLFRALGWQPPRYGHFPVLMAEDGVKLSKSRLAPALDNRAAVSNLLTAARALHLIADDEYTGPHWPSPTELLQFLLPRWSRARYAGVTELDPAPPPGSRDSS